MESGRAAESTAEFVASGGFADVMDDDESGVGLVAEAEQGLAKSGHGAGVVFVLIVSGVERVDDKDFGLDRTGGVKEVIQAGGGAEQMAAGAGVDKEIGIGAIADALAHSGEPESKLRSRQFKLKDQDAARSRDVETGVVAAGGERQSEVGDAQRFSGLGFAADKEDALGGQQPRLNQARLGRRTIGKQRGQR